MSSADAEAYSLSAQATESLVALDTCLKTVLGSRIKVAVMLMECSRLRKQLDSTWAATLTVPGSGAEAPAVTAAAASPAASTPATAGPALGRASP